jgi:Na+/H+ antiporter NhaD/arsenite permease-like protein
VRGHGTPLVNTLLLLLGAALANVVGTTGASMLLIRPFMRINKPRLRAIHVVMFIFIVSNCGGSLTPIGDPPLYLGYLKGVPFFWTLHHLWRDWAFTIGALLLVFYIIDRRIGPAVGEATRPVAPRLGLRVRGAWGLLFLLLIILGVFIDPLLKAYAGLEGYPVGATFQVLVAALAYLAAPRHIHEANEFTFGPAKEVGLLFAGIFVAMAPALGYLGAHAGDLGLTSPTAFYFGTGALSAVLDNAPTYLNFLQVAFGPTEIDAHTMAAFLATPQGQTTVSAISTGAVFFGAMTYIGNGPNFMVKAIAEAAGEKMPSFFGYLGWACAILLPVLVLHWAVFIRQ